MRQAKNIMLFVLCVLLLLSVPEKVTTEIEAMRVVMGMIGITWSVADFIINL